MGYHKHEIGAIGMIKIARLFDPTLNLKEAKDEFDAFAENWKEATGEDGRVWNNEHYHTYFLLLYILTFVGNIELLLHIAPRVPDVVKAPFYQIVAGLRGVQVTELTELNDEMAKSMFEVIRDSAVGMAEMLDHIGELEEKEKTADAAEVEARTSWCTEHDMPLADCPDHDPDCATISVSKHH